MTEFLNTNSHRIYVDDPDNEDEDLTKLSSGQKISATGAFADNLDETSGVVRADSEQGKRFMKGEKTDQSPGLPVNHPDVLATSVTMVGETAEPTSDDIDDLNKAELLDMAKQREISGYSSMNKTELKKALKKSASEGGGTITTEDVPSK